MFKLSQKNSEHSDFYADSKHKKITHSIDPDQLVLSRDHDVKEDEALLER